MNHRSVAWSLGLVCLSALFLACFWPVLVQDRQFGFRDASHFYYPLYQRVQEEWDAGRWPLWEAEENAGMPLLGNPTAAVLYPVKILHAVLPYPWAARWYVILHVLLACLGMYLLARSWSISRSGSLLAALSYGFGAPVVFQACNIIFLVGAAWAPLGFRAVDRWVRLRRPWAIAELAVVLSLETLGGDPQIAYLTGLCAAGYAVIWRAAEAGRLPRWLEPRWLAVWSIVLALGLVGGTLIHAYAVSPDAPLPIEAASIPKPPSVLPPWPLILLGIWAVVGVVALAKSWNQPTGRSILAAALGLLAAAGLAGLLCGAQLLPVAEFTAMTSRAAEDGAHDMYPFSVEPVRLVELIWPNVYGNSLNGNTLWIRALPTTDHFRPWSPSLYCGGLTALLALAALGLRNGPPWRAWMSVVLVVSLLAAIGEYTGPLFWARYVPEIARDLGPHDKLEEASTRLDGYLRDGQGGIYWLLSKTLPGFASFRYPAKLMTLVVLAGSVLAGWCWDELARGRRARFLLSAVPAFLLTVGVLIAAFAYREFLVEWLRTGLATRLVSPFGPIDPEAAMRATRAGLLHGGVVLGVSVLLGALAPRLGTSRLAGLALVLLTTDLIVANRQMLSTVPQSLFDGTPEVVRKIEEAEREKPSDGPFRVHRMPLWNPAKWANTPSNDRVADFVAWERGTIQPKFGITEGVEYTLTEGTAELFDYSFFFAGFYRSARRLEEGMAASMGIQPGQKLVYYPRRAFDLWNTRYFVLPAVSGDWSDEERGFASFLFDVEPVYPSAREFEGPDGKTAKRAWIEDQDYQILRNLNVFPRAWVVHDARFLSPIEGLSKRDRKVPYEEMLFQNDPFWNDSTRPIYNLKTLAFVEVEDPATLAGFLSKAPGDPAEKVKVIAHSPQHVELRANLKTPGLVILGDVLYPGWKLTIDDQPASIVRVNRVMRGAAVQAGSHTLVYRYEPASFRRGALLSLAGLGLLAGYSLWAGWWSYQQRVRGSPTPPIE